MNLVRWKRYTWDLEKAPPSSGVVLHSFQVRPATKEDEKSVGEVIFNAFALDFGWGDVFKSYRLFLEGQLEAAFDRPAIPVLVAKHGQRNIAASLLSIEPDAENNLFSGPCVLSEYRNRGIGTALLRESLQMLHSSGLNRVRGVCKDASPASKFVYRKFGSTSEAYDFEPAELLERFGA